MESFFEDLEGKMGDPDVLSDQKEYNRSLRDDPTLCSCESLYAKVFTLKQYADRRRSTDLTRFSFCPDCGKRIDWKSIAEESRPP